jgi:hypothetical protein
MMSDELATNLQKAAARMVVSINYNVEASIHKYEPVSVRSHPDSELRKSSLSRTSQLDAAHVIEDEIAHGGKRKIKIQSVCHPIAYLFTNSNF